MIGSPPLVLVDGSGYIFRAFYAVRPLSTSTGVPTNAVTGFARMLGRLLKDERPTLLGIAFDSREKTFRHEIFADYKANRDEPPEDLVPQFELVRDLVRAMDIPVLAQPGYEADDIIATLARRATEQGLPVIVVTGDKDLMQLVSPSVTIFDPMKDQRFDRDAVIAKFGVPPERVVDVLALAGDASDNIPGVPRVGPKSAAQLVQAYGDVEQVIAAVTKLPKPKAYERSVAENAESARLSKRLAQLCLEAPVPFDLEKLRFNPPRQEKLGPFLRRIEAFGLLRELGFAGEPAADPAAAPSPAPIAAPVPGPAPATVPPPAPAITVSAIDRSRYRTILQVADLEAELEAARAAGELSVDLETTSIEPTRADIVGIAMAVPGRAPTYLPVDHRYLGAPKQLERAMVLERMRPLLEDAALRKIGQNIKYDRIVFRRAGVHLAGIADDSMLAAWVLDPSRPSYSMDTLAREYLGHETIRYGDVTGTGKHQIGFDEVPVELATAYSAEDADVALRLTRMLVPKIEAAGLAGVYRELELPLIEVLAAMEETGVAIDAPYLGRLSQELAGRLLTIEQRAHAMIGEPINLASPKQLATLFFDKLGYPVVKKTKTGYSTDQEVLEILAKTYDLPQVILEHRLLAKLKSTYVDALPKMQNPQTGRVHTSFNQTGTATGRLSSSDPNLQNIPIRSDDGRRIREAFITAPGWEVLSADYSQIELRVMAHLSGDDRFVEAFRRGEDVHERTAREVLTGGAPPTPEQRRQAKAINFGILYGLSDFGLSRQLGISKGDANAFITAYFARYPGIRRHLDRTIEEGREKGYVVTIAGRRRFLPDLKSRNRTAQQAAERVAMNTPIQGSAADIIKLAMIRVARAITERRLRARLLLQVHDELVIEAPREEREEVLAVLHEEMPGVMQLSVPLTIDVGHGSNWATAH